jgi:hypothetical protein
MCGRPLDAREKVRSLTGGSIAIMCPAWSTRHHDRWPRWDPRCRPKHFGDFESRCTKWVLWIVGWTDRHQISRGTFTFRVALTAVTVLKSWLPNYLLTPLQP